MMKNRFIWADSLKGYLIMLVILGHAIQTVMSNEFGSNHIWNLIYSFHMPAFMSVSGWFSFKDKAMSSDNAILTIKRRTLQLLIPYLLWSIALYLIRGDFSFNALYNIVLIPDSYFWFLWVLFWICLLFIFAQLIASKFALDELVIVGFVGILLMSIMIGFEFRHYGFQFISYYFLFYTLGYCIHRFSFMHTKNFYYLSLMTILWGGLLGSGLCIVYLHGYVLLR